MDIKILHYDEGPTALWGRYTGSEPIPGYDDITQIWELQNDIQDVITAVIDDVVYEITRKAKKGLYSDKASTPGESSDWYPARRDYIWHDTDFSCHYLRRFAQNNDDGFRATNLMFEAGIGWHIDQARKAGKISRVRSFFWHIKKRFWYRAVNSIAGQGRYVNGRPSRGNHGQKSSIHIVKLRG